MTPQPQLYSNPACSKCRTAVALLEEHHVQADTIRYLDEPPTVADLKGLMRLLDIDDPRLMMRTGETVYAELALADQEGDALLEAISRASRYSWNGPSSLSATGPSLRVRPRGSSNCSDDPRPGPEHPRMVCAQQARTRARDGGRQ